MYLPIAPLVARESHSARRMPERPPDHVKYELCLSCLYRFSSIFLPVQSDLGSEVHDWDLSLLVALELRY